ncbi:serine/threonine-protein kinase brsk/sad1-like protein [Dermatophagoides farinae]|uniref:Serine/threonine-protein kinase brsk/sad1-like protein n=1 Tax=Dermatophagoides farinae TaxID=6954 RepID=A0A9D4NTG0_DERFA|nr:serine/threonine-protein kinase brsk/sad1-like protein [Dermatophagoides farinae]
MATEPNEPTTSSHRSRPRSPQLKSPKPRSPQPKSPKPRSPQPKSPKTNNTAAAAAVVNKADQFRATLLDRRSKSIARTLGPIPIESSPSFELYQFEQTNSNLVSIRSEFGEKIYRVRHRNFPQIPMVVRIYSKEQASRIHNKLYFKILRHLGKKHPLILQTWDIFVNQDYQYLVFQQHTHTIDLTQYILGRQPDGEQELVVCHWSRELYRALDYLINSAVCHNNLTSSCVLISLRDKMSIQLTGFYRSFIYQSSARNNLRPRQSIRDRETIRPDFKPPEVFGSEHQTGKYDPLIADMWSLGAIIYFAISGEYPHDYKIRSKNIEKEIQFNLDYFGSRISKQAHDLLANLLTSKVNKRLKLDRMNQHPWFSMFKTVEQQESSMTTFNNSEITEFRDDDDQLSALSRYSSVDMIPEPTTTRGRGHTATRTRRRRGPGKMEKADQRRPYLKRQRQQRPATDDDNY